MPLSFWACLSSLVWFCIGLSQKLALKIHRLSLQHSMRPIEQPYETVYGLICQADSWQGQKSFTLLLAQDGCLPLPGNLPKSGSFRSRFASTMLPRNVHPLRQLAEPRKKKFIGIKSSIEELDSRKWIAIAHGRQSAATKQRLLQMFNCTCHGSSLGTYETNVKMKTTEW